MSCAGFCKHQRQIHRLLSEIDADDLPEYIASVAAYQQAHELAAQAASMFVASTYAEAPDYAKGHLRVVKPEEQN